MAHFRVDYVTEDGERGVWHDLVSAGDVSEVILQCRGEIDHISQRLRRDDEKDLKELVVVLISESDVARVTGT